MEMTENNNDTNAVGFNGKIVWRPWDGPTYRRMRVDGEIYTREIVYKHGIIMIHDIRDRDIFAPDDEWVLCEGKLPKGLEFDRGFIYGLTTKIGEYDLRYRVIMKDVGIYEIRVHISVQKFKKIGWEVAGSE